MLGILCQLTVFILDFGAGISCCGNKSIVGSVSGGKGCDFPLCMAWLGGGGGGITGGAVGGAGMLSCGKGGGGGGGPPGPITNT